MKIAGTSHERNEIESPPIGDGLSENGFSAVRMRYSLHEMV